MGRISPSQADPPPRSGAPKQALETMTQQLIGDSRAVDVQRDAASPIDLNGAMLHRGFLDRAEQEAMLADVLAVAQIAPFLRPTTPWGKPMSVAMTSAGRFGWVTDRKGYRYQATHPETDGAWPAIPPSVLAVWAAVADIDAPPDSCLINRYGENARLGLHQDKNEEDYRYPVVSISLGDPARFRIGGTTRGGPTQSTMLESGDVLVMGGAARLAYHGVDRIRFGGSTLLAEGGRINLTLRRVAAPSETSA